jgi:hypothetical protein
MKTKNLLASLLLILSLAPALSWSQTKCEQIFATEVQPSKIQANEVLSNKILQFMDLLGAGNTTSLRQEDKYVVAPAVVNQVLQDLAGNHGSQFQLRDKKNPGRKNVTLTQYALPIKLKIPGEKKISAKIRFRKYFDTDATFALGKAEMHPADIVKDRQFVEFKIDHPVYGNVVIKPRMIMLDSDATLLENKDTFNKNKTTILARTLEINPKTDPKVVQQFFSIFTDIYAENIPQLPKYAKTAYVRDSYSLMLKDRHDKTVEIQLTIDQEINVENSRTGEVIRAYRPEDVVVELKVPLNYAALTPANLQEVPGLKDVVQLKNILSQNHIQSYAPGSGKLSTFSHAQELEE